MDDSQFSAALTHAAARSPGAEPREHADHRGKRLLSIPSVDTLASHHRQWAMSDQCGHQRLVLELDKLQYSLSEGPCMDTPSTARPWCGPPHPPRPALARYVPLRSTRSSTARRQLYLTTRHGRRSQHVLHRLEDIDPQAPGIPYLFAPTRRWRWARPERSTS